MPDVTHRYAQTLSHPLKTFLVTLWDPKRRDQHYARCGAVFSTSRESAPCNAIIIRVLSCAPVGGVGDVLALYNGSGTHSPPPRQAELLRGTNTERT